MRRAVVAHNTGFEPNCFCGRSVNANNRQQTDVEMDKEPMDILAALTDTYVGRHTRWFWSRMLAIADGGPPLGDTELSKHFAPSVLAHVPAQQLAIHFTQLAPIMRQVTCLIEETSSDTRYSALLALPDGWLRYTSAVEETTPHLLIEAAYSRAMAPSAYLDRSVQRDGRNVRLRDFGGAGPLMLLWHGAGCDLTCWETLVPHLTGFRVVAHDLPGHGRSPLPAFRTSDALADADAVIAELDVGPPIVVGHSLGGYLALHYAATRKCSGWIGLDGPFAVVYPWEADDPGSPESVLQIGREIRAMDVARDLAAIRCPAMLILCSIAASQIEEPMVPARREIAEHIARCHTDVRVEWVQTGHDAMLFGEIEATAARIREFRLSCLHQNSTAAKNNP